MNENKGISISGSAHVQAGAMAAGTNARAVNAQRDDSALDQLRRDLAGVIAELRTLAATDPSLERAVSTAEEIDEELGNEQPDRNRVTRLLGQLGVRVESLGKVAAAVLSLENVFN